jgi:hypothetical protein
LAITSTRDKLRLTIGDTNEDSALFQDDELDYFLTARADNILLAAADACDAAAAKFSQAYDFTTDAQSFQRSQQAAAYRAMAAQFRQRAGGIAVVTPTRVDGYSDDIANDDVGESGLNPRRRFYGEEDRIP